MGEENRGSSGSSTVMIVVAILGGILLLGCCGGVAVIGAGALWVRSEVREVQTQIERMPMPSETATEIRVDPLKAMPDEPPMPLEPEIAPVAEPPVVEEKRE